MKTNGTNRAAARAIKSTPPALVSGPLASSASSPVATAEGSTPPVIDDSGIASGAADFARLRALNPEAARNVLDLLRALSEVAAAPPSPPVRQRTADSPTGPLVPTSKTSSAAITPSERKKFFHQWMSECQEHWDRAWDVLVDGDDGDIQDAMRSIAFNSGWFLAYELGPDVAAWRTYITDLLVIDGGPCLLPDNYEPLGFLDAKYLPSGRR